MFWLLIPWMVLGGFGAIWGMLRVGSNGEEA
jgi:hypothetical protein